MSTSRTSMHLAMSAAAFGLRPVLWVGIMGCSPT